MAARAPRGRQELGRLGEDAAARWYEVRGFEVIARNWRSSGGEIDLVVRKGPLTVFCEVKTRSSTSHGTPAEAVTARKRTRLRRLAAAFLAQADRTGVRGPVRFDVAAVLNGRLEVIEGAF